VVIEKNPDQTAFDAPWEAPAGLADNEALALLIVGIGY